MLNSSLMGNRSTTVVSAVAASLSGLPAAALASRAASEAMQHAVSGVSSSKSVICYRVRVTMFSGKRKRGSSICVMLVFGGVAA